MGMKVWKYAGNTTNLRSHHENSARALFQALQQTVKAKENDASMRQVTIMMLSLS